MFNLLCNCTETCCPPLSWKITVIECVHMVCWTVILLTLMILLFFSIKYLIMWIIQEKRESNRNKMLLEKLNICRCDNCPQKDESPDNTPKNLDKNNDKK